MRRVTGSMCSTQVINKLEQKLKEYDKVILLTEPYFSLEIACDINVNKKVLIMSKELIDIVSKGFEFDLITSQEESEIINLYHTYEFSDCFKVISDSPHSFGGVLNLYRKGILNDEEVVKIILY